jgi:hypothetical protein
VFGRIVNRERPVVVLFAIDKIARERKNVRESDFKLDLFATQSRRGRQGRDLVKRPFELLCGFNKRGSRQGALSRCAPPFDSGLTFALDYPHRVAGLVVIAPPTHPWLGQTMWLYSVFAIPVVGWVFAHTLTLPFGALLIGPGFRGAFLPQSPPPGYLKRSVARLLLRPATLLANAADIVGLKAFLKRQAGRYETLAAPIVVITGDRETVVSPRHHATRFAAAVPGASVVIPTLVSHVRLY